MHIYIYAKTRAVNTQQTNKIPVLRPHQHVYIYIYIYIYIYAMILSSILAGICIYIYIYLYLQNIIHTNNASIDAYTPSAHLETLMASEPRVTSPLGSTSIRVWPLCWWQRMGDLLWPWRRAGAVLGCIFSGSAEGSLTVSALKRYGVLKLPSFWLDVIISAPFSNRINPDGLRGDKMTSAPINQAVLHETLPPKNERRPKTLVSIHFGGIGGFQGPHYPQWHSPIEIIKNPYKPRWFNQWLINRIQVVKGTQLPRFDG